MIFRALVTAHLTPSRARATFRQSTRMNSIIQQDLISIAREPLPWSSFSGASVLISGAAGFLPAYMVETLLFLNECVLSHPARVTALVRDEERALTRFAEYAKRDDLNIVVHDVCNPLPHQGQYDFIIHAASQASPRFFKTDPVGTLSANVFGTYNLLDAATKHEPCRGFLFFSSGEVYGSVNNALGAISEDQGGYLDPTDVRSCYGESKRMGETMCACWASQFGTPTKIIRLGHTYGPGMRLDDGRVFADFVRDILQGGPIVMHSDGTARRPFCYLADATAAAFTVLLRGEAGQAYNVINPSEECSIAELADRLAALYESEGIYVESRARVDKTYSPSAHSGAPVSVEKVRKLGWQAQTSIEQGFRRTVESFREAGYGKAIVVR
jgi:UDP-glucuronate decarboxylase